MVDSVLRDRLRLATYGRILLVAFQRGIEYRFGVVYLLIEALLPTIAMCYLWLSIYAHGGRVAGYTFSAMITYFIGARFVDYIAWYPIDWKLNEDIHSGSLTHMLIKPVSVQAYYFSEMIGNRIVNAVIGCAPLALFAWALHGILHLQWQPGQFLLCLAAIVGASCLWFFMSFIIGCYAFWVQNAGNLLFLKQTLVMILAGTFFPLDLLPHGIVHILQYFPFPYLAFFPLKILSGQLSSANIWAGIGLQWLWILVFMGLGRLVWQKGLKSYVVVGG